MSSYRILTNKLDLTITFTVAAVIAFGAVYKLETTRRDNDNKVKLLYVEMKEMMRVLLRFVI